MPKPPPTNHDDHQGHRAEAFDLLKQRGFSTMEIGRAKTMIEEIGRIGDRPSSDLEARQRDFEMAEKKIWGWYGTSSSAAMLTSVPDTFGGY